LLLRHFSLRNERELAYCKYSNLFFDYAIATLWVDIAFYFTNGIARSIQSNTTSGLSTLPSAKLSELVHST